MPALTEANYQSRRIKLAGQIHAAQEHYHTTAFATELGQATDDELLSAKSSVDALEGRLMGLDAAWASRAKAVADEQEAAEIAARNTAHKFATNLLGKRVEAAADLEKAALALAEAHSAYEKTGTDILAAVAPVASHLGRDGMGHLRVDATGRFGSPQFLIAGLLKEHGLDLSGVDAEAAGFRVREVGVVPFVKMHNENIVRRIEDLLPEHEA